VAELRCEGIAKAYGARAVLAGIDLTVPEGTVTAILGSSGSGKTTLLRVIMGFLPADRGTVTVGGAVVEDAGRVHLTADRRQVGYVAQEGALFPHLTVAENVGFGLPRAERKSGTRVHQALDLVGLAPEYFHRNVHELSGGEQRRVALARALAPRPQAVLLDEPFSGLDAALRAETRESVLGALAQTGATAVLVTHDQAEALLMGREVAVLRQGRLVQTATPSDLYRTPVDLDVARFVGAAAVLPGTVRGGAAECALGLLPLRAPVADGPADVMIRPEQIRLIAAAASAPAAARPALARVVGWSYYGADTVVHLELVDGSGLRIASRTFDDEPPSVGTSVGVAVAGPVCAYPAASPGPDPGPPARGGSG
jgi:iron(III) transport system ATP-binding protein